MKFRIEIYEKSQWSVLMITAHLTPELAARVASRMEYFHNVPCRVVVF